jgi:epoxyqueuosine reductase QueG
VSRHTSQEHCPWNGPKLVQIAAERDYRPAWREAENRPDVPDGLPDTESPSLIELLETALDEAAWDAFSRGSAIRRAGRAGFARNVAVALGNWGAEAAVPVLTEALSDASPLVREHAAWALGQIGSSISEESFELRAAAETDP